MSAAERYYRAAAPKPLPRATDVLLADLPPHLQTLVRCMVDGTTDCKAQARLLGLALSTIRNYWQAVYAITGCANMTAVAVWAFPQVQAQRAAKQHHARVDWLLRHNARRVHDAVASLRHPTGSHPDAPA